jgi:hypothetical protein
MMVHTFTPDQSDQPFDKLMSKRRVLGFKP